MRKLHLVGLTTDRDGLIFTARKGSKSGGFVVPLEDDVLKAVAEAQAGRRVGGAAVDGEGEAGGAAPRRPRQESALTPREMQARLRAGRSIEEVAAEAGVENDWVARFAVPILAEQAQVVELARGLVYAKPRLGESTQALGASVMQNLSDRGVFLPEDVADPGWSAFQLHDAVWMVRFRYRSRGRNQEAQWEVDVPAGRLLARNRHASDLGYVEPDRRQRLLAAIEEEADDTPPPSRRPARAPARQPTPARPSAKKKAPARKAAGRVSKPAAKQPAPSKGRGKIAAPAGNAKRPAATMAAAVAAGRRASGSAPAPAATKARRPTATRATPASEPGPPAGSGGVRSAVAQISTARVSASLAAAERKPWAAVVQPRPAARPAPANGSETWEGGRPMAAAPPAPAPAAARRVPAPAPAPAPDRPRRAQADPEVLAFEPRPLPAAEDRMAATRARRQPAPRAEVPPGAPRPVSLPAPRQPSPRQDPMPVERPKRRRLRSR